MTEWVTYGSVGGAAGNSRSSPELVTCDRHVTVSSSEQAPAASSSYRG